MRGMTCLVDMSAGSLCERATRCRSRMVHGRQHSHVYLSGRTSGVQVQEAAAASEGFLHMPDAQLNMGILCLALEKPKEAVQVGLPCMHPSALILTLLPPLFKTSTIPEDSKHIG